MLFGMRFAVGFVFGLVLLALAFSALVRLWHWSYGARDNCC